MLRYTHSKHNQSSMDTQILYIHYYMVHMRTHSIIRISYNALAILSCFCQSFCCIVVFSASKYFLQAVLISYLGVFSTFRSIAATFPTLSPNTLVKTEKTEPISESLYTLLYSWHTKLLLMAAQSSEPTATDIKSKLLHLPIQNCLRLFFLSN